MAVRICTATRCIVCQDKTRDQVLNDLEATERDGKHYYCCGNAKSDCVRIDKIETVSTVREPDDGDDEGWGGLDLGHPDIVIVTGGYSSRRRR